MHVGEIIKKTIIKKLSIDAITDSDKLALWLHAFFVLCRYICCQHFEKSSQNELQDEKQIKRRSYLDYSVCSALICSTKMY